MDQHNLVVHSRIRDDRIGDGPPSDGSPTTAPRSEGPPESDALDTVFGEEEALGEGGTNLDSTQGGSQDGDTGGTGSVKEEVCQPCSPQPVPCPGHCIGFLGWAM